MKTTSIIAVSEKLQRYCELLDYADDRIKQKQDHIRLMERLGLSSGDSKDRIKTTKLAINRIENRIKELITNQYNDTIRHSKKN
jgi:hypothetical protein